MSVEQLIRDYESSEQKDTAIRNLAQKYNISQKEIIDLLKKYNIEIPRILNRAEALGFDDFANEVYKDIELDKEVYTAVSIGRQFSDMGWDKKDKPILEKAKELAYYIKTTYGIDSFYLYVKLMDYIIRNNGVFSLEKSIENIKNGKSSIGVEQRVVNTLLGITERIVDELTETDMPELELSEKPKLEKPLLERFSEVYLALKHPEYYRALMIKKQHKQKQKTLQAIDNALRRAE